MTISSEKPRLRGDYIVQWLLNSIPGLPEKWQTTGIPYLSNRLKEFKSLAEDKTIEIAKDRLFSQPQVFITTGSRQQDLLPSGSLSIGAARSLAVCRIARYFSLPDFQELIDEIIQKIVTKIQSFTGLNKEQKVQNEHELELIGSFFGSIEVLNEAFLISDQLSSEIFKKIQILSREQEEVLGKIQIKEELAELVRNSICLLKTLRELTEAQLAKLNPVPVGSGFLVGVSHILTNFHVIPSKKVALQCVAQFNYTESSEGATQQTIDYELDPHSLFISEADLDYSLLQLKTNPFVRQAGLKFGWLQMIEQDNNILPKLDETSLKTLRAQLKNRKSQLESLDNIGMGDDIFIIHHPKGRQKKLDLTNNRVTLVSEDCLRYKSDSDFGSSGSPVFNTKWELVALHHAAIPEDRSKGFIQQGIRICRIVEDLKQKSAWDRKLRGFIEDFVVTSEQLNHPPLSSALNFNGSDQYVSISLNQKEPNHLDSDRFAIEAWVSPDLSVASGTIFSKVCQEPWDIEFKEKWRTEDTIFNQYLEYLYITKKRELIFTRRAMWLVSHSNFPENGLLYVQIKTEDGKLKHPLDILYPGDSHLTEPDKVRAIQSIFYHLSLYNTERNLQEGSINFFDPKDYKERVSGKLDEETHEAYEQFRQRYLRGEGSSELKFPLELTIVDKLRLAGTHLKPIRTRSPVSALDNQLNYPAQRGTRIVELQETLKSLASRDAKANIKLKVTGVFDKETEDAVKWLQRENDLVEDGIFGPLALKALEEAKSYEVRTRDTLPPGQFSHVAVTGNFQETRSRSDAPKNKVYPEIKIYVDGQLLARRYVGQQSRGRISEAALGALRGKNPLDLKAILQPDYRLFFRGRMAEVRIWSIELQQSKIVANLYRRLEGESLKDPNLIGYWRFEEGANETDQDPLDNLASSASLLSQGNLQTQPEIINPQSASEGEALDRSREVLSGTRWINASQFSAVPLPFAVEFDARSGGIDCFDHEISNTIPVGGITAELWVKCKFGNGVLLSRLDDQQGNYILSWEDARICVELSNSSSERTKVKTQDCVPNDQAWHHIAFTWDAITHKGKTGEIEIYVDGRRQNVFVVQGEGKSLMDANSNKSYGIFRGKIKGNLTQNLTIGTQTVDLHKNQVLFKGAIAELRLWKTVRTATEIKTNMYCRLKVQAEENQNLVSYWRLDACNLSNSLEKPAIPDESFNSQPKFIVIAPPKKVTSWIDVSTQHWAYKFIQGLSELGLISSFIDVTQPNSRQRFRPRAYMTKGEYSALLVSIFGGEPKLKYYSQDEERKPDCYTVPDFKDKDIQLSPYFSDIQYGYQLGLLSEETQYQASLANSKFRRAIYFDYKKPMDRQEIINSLFDAMRYDLEPKGQLQDILSGYEDFRSDTCWMGEQKLATAIKRGIVVRRKEQSLRHLELERQATRSEIATMVYQSLVWLKLAPPIDSDLILQ